MSKSKSLRLSDVRAAFRLVGDCRDVGRDPAAWNAVLVRGLTGMFGCYMSQALVGTQLAGGAIADAAGLADDWPDSAAYRWWLAFLAREEYLALPSFVAFNKPFVRVTTARREELVPTAVWDRSAEKNELRSPCEQEEFIYSGAPVAGAPGRYHGLSLNRPVGAPAFTERERRLVELIHEEVAALVGTRLLLSPDQLVSGLPPRLKEVLTGLLEGDTEKQLAARLGLSRHTVHEYVIALYRRFGVRSRADLVRVCLRPPGGQSSA